MLNYDDLKVGTTFIYESEPYEVLEYEFMRMQQRKPVAQTKIVNLLNGKILSVKFHVSERFEEVEIEQMPVKFIYMNRGECWFTPLDNPAGRFSLKVKILGDAAQFLKANTEVIAMKWGEKVIKIKPPIKIDLLIKETPPGERGNTAQSGTKAATLETGATIQVPLFVNTGDVIRVNTTTGEYTERVEKSK